MTDDYFAYRSAQGAEMWQRLLKEIRMLQTGIIVAFESIRNRRR